MRRDHRRGFTAALACSALGLFVTFLLASDGNDRLLLDPSAWFVFALVPEYSPYVCWFVAGLIGWLVARILPSGKRSIESEVRSISPRRSRAAIQVVLFVLTFVLGFGCSAYFGQPVRDLPPAYHDEYSYLFQARTFELIRLSVPSPAAHEHFAQMHVLIDEHRCASRYFPATGLWILRFDRLDAGVVSGWVAQGLVVGFFSLAASEVSMTFAIILASWLIASPGLVVFSNTLLSPHPTMLGLAVAWWAFVRTRRPGSSSLWFVLLSIGLGWSFLARPVTAIALALPWLLDVAPRSLVAYPRRWGIPFLLALGFLPAPMALTYFNASITGSALLTPYGQYTAEYSPSHVYGFYNRTRGEQAKAPRRLDAFDDWAPELTPRRAWNLTIARWDAAIPWMLGATPLIAGLALALLNIRRLGDAIVLPALSIFGLTCAHVPFAFQGIFGWSYLVEATPFVLWIASLGFARMIDCRTFRQQPLLGLWLGAGVAIPVLISLLVVLPSAFDESSEFIHPRRRHAERLATETALCVRPSLIIYDIDRRDDLHSTYVTNPPTFDGLILRAWALDDMRSLVSAYPDRDIYVCRRDGDRLRYESVPSGRP